MVKKCNKGGRRCTRSIRERKEVFGKCWRNGGRFSGSDCRVEGCVEKEFEMWKEVFKKQLKSGRRCSGSDAGVEICDQEVLMEWKLVFKKQWRSRRRCSTSAV